ncbi:hypothetical protein IE077_001493, partial [Cardiosporidium cionae]
RVWNVVLEVTISSLQRYCRCSDSFPYAFEAFAGPSTTIFSSYLDSTASELNTTAIFLLRIGIDSLSAVFLGNYSEGDQLHFFCSFCSMTTILDNPTPTVFANSTVEDISLESILELCRENGWNQSDRFSRKNFFNFVVFAIACKTESRPSLFFQPYTAFDVYIFVYICERIVQEIFEIVRNLNDPEHPYTLEQLKVVQEDMITIDEENQCVHVRYTPTIPHCSQATLIGLMMRVKLMRCLPERFKIDVQITPGAHDTEEAVNKQLNDKERVAAALENPSLQAVINRGEYPCGVALKRKYEKSHFQNIPERSWFLKVNNRIHRTVFMWNLSHGACQTICRYIFLMELDLLT